MENENRNDWSPDIPCYEEFKKHLDLALSNSNSNWFRKKITDEMMATASKIFQPTASRIYQRRMAHRQNTSPYTRST